MVFLHAFILMQKYFINFVLIRFIITNCDKFLEKQHNKSLHLSFYMMNHWQLILTSFFEILFKIDIISTLILMILSMWVNLLTHFLRWSGTANTSSCQCSIYEFFFDEGHSQHSELPDILIFVKKVKLI